MRAVPKLLQRRPIPPKNGTPPTVPSELKHQIRHHRGYRLHYYLFLQVHEPRRREPHRRQRPRGPWLRGVARQLLRKLVTSIIFYIQPSPRLRIAQAHLFTKLYRGATRRQTISSEWGSIHLLSLPCPKEKLNCRHDPRGTARSLCSKTPRPGLMGHPSI